MKYSCSTNTNHTRALVLRVKYLSKQNKKLEMMLKLTSYSGNELKSSILHRLTKRHNFEMIHPVVFK